MDYQYSQDPNTKRWTCRELYSEFLKLSGTGETKEEALANLFPGIMGFFFH